VRTINDVLLEPKTDQEFADFIQRSALKIEVIPDDSQPSSSSRSGNNVDDFDLHEKEQEFADIFGQVSE